MYRLVMNSVKTATATLAAKGDTFEIAGLLYLQGESDSAAEAAVAGTNFKNLVDNLRIDLPDAGSMFGMIAGIAAAGPVRDIVRANQKAIADSTDYIDHFSDLDLESWAAPVDNLHLNKAAKLRIGERYAQAFFAAGIVARQYGNLVFIGDSITQGGNGDHPGYRYTVFNHLANRGVPINAGTGYRFTGSVAGAYQDFAVTTPNVNGQAFENIHDGHSDWRASWVCARVALPAGRYNVNNVGSGTLQNWTGQTNTFVTADAGISTYTGAAYSPDTAAIMIGINDFADGVAETQVRDDIGALIDQLRARSPNVRIFLNNVLRTNQGATRDTQVTNLNALLPALVAAKNAASTNSPVWLVDADTGFNPVTMTYDNVHPNATGESYVGDRIAAAFGLLETPLPGVVTVGEPPFIESGSANFQSRFEGNEIWNGSALINSWAQTGTPTKALINTTDLRLVNPGTNSTWIEGVATGWNNANDKSWTFETRLKFDTNANGFIIWLGTDTRRILVEIHGDHTVDSGNAFSVAHNNLDGAFHTFRIAHDAVNARCHVWRDAVRLTPLAGVAYDTAAADSRLIMGDYTAGTFGNDFDVTIDYVRYDQTGACLPSGADADNDGLPDSWEYLYYSPGGTNYAAKATAVTNAVAGADDDGDGFSNYNEYIANTDPRNAASALKPWEVSRPGGNVVQVILLTSTQRKYTLLRSSDLGLTDPWTAVAGPTFGTDGNLMLQDTNAIGLCTFYRISVSLP